MHLVRLFLVFLRGGGQAAASLKADLTKLTSSAAVEVEEELSSMSARRKELSSKNVSGKGPSFVPPDEVTRG